MTPTFSVLIPTLRRNHLLRWNLESLRLTGDVEAFVLDDSHEGDEGCRRLADQFDVRYLHTGKTKPHEHWRMPGFAFNIGAKLSSGKNLVLSCAEIYHPQDTLEQMAGLVSDNAIVIPKAVRDDKGSVLAALQGGRAPTDIGGLRVLDGRLPFFMSMSRSMFLGIGGYDEDFTGVCWDDNDITERLILHGGRYARVDAEVVHLHHRRHNYRSAEIKERWNHNKKIYDERRGQAIRNEGREWGVLP
jgi:glycosyltransferase involved in cell wall biosynthesis